MSYELIRLLLIFVFAISTSWVAGWVRWSMNPSAVLAFALLMMYAIVTMFGAMVQLLEIIAPGWPTVPKVVLIICAAFLAQGSCDIAYNARFKRDRKRSFARVGVTDAS